MLISAVVCLWICNTFSWIQMTDASLLLAASTLLGRFVPKPKSPMPSPGNLYKQDSSPPALEIPVFEPIHDPVYKSNPFLHHQPLLFWYPKQYWPPMMLNYEPPFEGDEDQQPSASFQYPTLVPPTSIPFPVRRFPSPPMRLFWIEREPDEVAKHPFHMIMPNPGEMVSAENRPLKVLNSEPSFHSQGLYSYKRPNRKPKVYLGKTLPQMQHLSSFRYPHESKLRDTIEPEIGTDSRDTPTQETVLRVSNDLPVLYHRYPFYPDELESKALEYSRNNRKPYNGAVENHVDNYAKPVKTVNWPHNSRYEPVEINNSTVSIVPDSLLVRTKQTHPHPYKAEFRSRKGEVDSIQDALLAANSDTKQQFKTKPSTPVGQNGNNSTTDATKETVSADKQSDNREWNKDEGYAKHGWKNVYHKEEWGEAKKYHDVWRFKDWKKKYNDQTSG